MIITIPNSPYPLERSTGRIAQRDTQVVNGLRTAMGVVTNLANAFFVNIANYIMRTRTRTLPPVTRGGNFVSK